MISPGFVMPYPASFEGIGVNGVPPIASMTSRNVSCMCLTCRYSSSLHFTRNRSTGMPYRSTTFGSISQ